VPAALVNAASPTALTKIAATHGDRRGNYDIFRPWGRGPVTSLHGSVHIDDYGGLPCSRV